MDAGISLELLDQYGILDLDVERSIDALLMQLVYLSFDYTIDKNNTIDIESKAFQIAGRLAKLCEDHKHMIPEESLISIINKTTKYDMTDIRMVVSNLGISGCFKYINQDFIPIIMRYLH